MKHVDLTDELQEKAALFASGAMDRAEAAEYLRHLEDETCPACSREVSEYRATLGMLSYDLPPAEPSAAAKARLMSQARLMSESVQRRQMARARPRWLSWALGMGAVAACGALLLVYRDNIELRGLNQALSSRLAVLESQLSQNLAILAAFTSPEVRIVNLAGQNQSPQAAGRIFWDQRRNRWMFSARDLPRVADNLTYQLWFVPTEGNPVSMSVFNAGADGAVNLEIPLPAGLATLKAAAVTTEPAGGLPQPSGQFALLGAAD